jgi:probable F420-dependent oxidoreductase
MSTIEPTRTTSPLAFGVCIPNFRPGARPEGMLAATLTAERLGWHSVWTTDHVLIDSAERGANYRHIYEALTVLAWLAGQTETIRLGMSVLVVPMRNAVVLAKELATIDALSGGRLIAGVGIGWNLTEFENLGVGDRFTQRGAYLEETVALWRHLWGGNTGPWQGRFHSFDEAHFSPLPTQGADVPVWIGATADKALRRVGRIAEGYQSTRTDPPTMRERKALISDTAATAGRPMPTMSTRLSVSFAGSERGVSILSGPPDEMIEQVRAYQDAGTEHLALDFGEVDPDAVAQAIERFDREIVAAL